MDDQRRRGGRSAGAGAQRRAFPAIQLPRRGGIRPESTFSPARRIRRSRRADLRWRLSPMKAPPAPPASPPGRSADPCVMVICGAGGDLTKRKLLPALCNLAKAGLLSKQFAIVGFSRGARSDEDFRKQMTAEIKEFATSPVEPELWNWFLQRIYYLGGDFKDPSAYEALADRLTAVEREHKTQGNVLYYLATGPEFFGEIVRQLHAVGLTRQENGRWRRVIVEKPFGADLESARGLNSELRKCLEEKQIY